MVLSRFKRRLFIPRDINGPLLAIKSLILYKDNNQIGEKIASINSVSNIHLLAEILGIASVS